MKSKIFIPAVLLAAVVMFSGCGKIKELADRTTGKNEKMSIMNMKQLMLGVLMYSDDNGDCFSNELNDLVAGGYITDTSLYVSPSDKRTVKAAPGSKLTSKNTSYAYLGKGINMSIGKMPVNPSEPSDCRKDYCMLPIGKMPVHPSDIPILIVKPWSLAKGEKMLVGYADGTVLPYPELKNPNKLTCRAVVEKICKQNNVPADVKEILLKNADKEDKARKAE